MELGKKDNYATFTRTNTENNEDEFGNRTSAIVAGDTIEFWCDVKDQKSNRVVDDGKRRNKRVLELMADSRDVDNLTIDHKGTIDGGATRYVVVDMFEHEFKFQSTIIIENID